MSTKAKLKASTAALKPPRESDDVETQRDPLPAPTGGPPPAAYSISEFCRAYRMSISFFHKLQRQGRGPVVMRVGARTLVSVAAAEQWRQEREAETAQTSARSAPATASNFLT